MACCLADLEMNAGCVLDEMLVMCSRSVLGASDILGPQWQCTVACVLSPSASLARIQCDGVVCWFEFRVSCRDLSHNIFESLPKDFGCLRVGSV